MVIKSHSITAESIWRDACSIKEERPLIHNITNYVVMEFTANVLLALGASPVMAHALEEVADMCSISRSLVVNIGTLSQPWIKSMGEAFLAAKKGNIPTVFDPVGAGATRYRTEAAKDFINRFCPTVIRGNASEIEAIASSKDKVSTKGVESTLKSESVIESAQALSKRTGSVVVISGASDYVIHGEHTAMVHNGHALMSKVTGMGCAATAIIGAFLSVNASPFLAAAGAMAFMSIAGELAGENAKAPGLFKTFFVDAIYNMDQSYLQSHLNIEIL